MTLKVDGTNGVLQAYDYQVLTTGFSYTFAAGTQTLVANPAGTLATGTITMPASPADGMVITVESTQQITALTVAGNTGQSLTNGTLTLRPNQPVSYVYRLSNTTWYPYAGATNSQIILGTAQATTSGTAIDFTGIPSWVKRITVMLDVVSTNGSSLVQVQIGTSGGIQTTGYASGAWQANITISSSTTGFLVVGSGAASNTITGHLTLTLMDSATGKWIASGVASLVPPTGSGNAEVFAGGKTLSGTLDRLRLTTVNGTDTFDAGSINIQYE